MVATIDLMFSKGVTQMSIHSFIADSETCTKCGACVRDCPLGVLELAGGTPGFKEGAAEKCFSCLHCVAVCPTGAVSLDGNSAASCRPIGTLPTGEQVANLLRARRSVRQYAKEDVPREEIENLLSALRAVPTGCNQQDLTFTVVSSRAQMDALRKKVLETLVAHAATLPDFIAGIVKTSQEHPGLDVFFRNAPHILIVQGNADCVTPQADAIAACAYFDLLAQAHGLGTCWCGFLKIMADAVPEVLDVFGLKPGTPYYAMLFGKPTVHYARTANRDAAAQTRWL